MESKEGFFGEDSLIASFQSNYENPILTSIERNYDPQNVIVEKTIYKEPKYKKDKNVYEEKEPIINNIIYLPEAKNNKERTAKPIIKAEKEFQDDYEMENYLNGDNFEDSIPTKSTILNIMQSKVFSPSTFQQSKAFSKYSNSHSSSKVNYNIINNNIYNTKSEIQKSNKINMLNNTECNLKKQSNYSYKSTKLNNNINSNYFNNKSMNIINNINKNTSINNKINNNIINSNINNNINNNISKNKSLQKQLSFNSGQIGPQPFMVARFGKKKVISQDLNTFLNSIKQAEWTNNPSYLAAKDIGVKPTFKINNSNNNEYNNIPKYSSTVDKLYLHLNKINIDDYINYANEINIRQNKIYFYVKKEKEQFIKNNFLFNEGKLDMNNILERIRNDYLSFISKDQILYNKINQAIN